MNTGDRLGTTGTEGVTISNEYDVNGSGFDKLDSIKTKELPSPGHKQLTYEEEGEKKGYGMYKRIAPQKMPGRINQDDIRVRYKKVSISPRRKVSPSIQKSSKRKAKSP